VIANDFVASGGSVLVQLSGNDAGFTTDGDCGAWTKVSSATTGDSSPQPVQSSSEIVQNRAQYEARRGGR
jgi:hypothetical protein